MRKREKVPDLIAGQNGRQHRKQLVRSLEDTAARAVVTATVTFAVGWVLKRMFEKSVKQAAKEGVTDGVDQKVAQRSGPVNAAGSGAPRRPAPQMPALTL